ncbi:zinc-finger of the MIZ type in Nse subunit-domain-containing protein [Cristinia sonorae]|uniref:Zinc-finger of the MIZ type in Nse subunit-domain-containing protein n=1 Tax=Cristinia sonorae TaxID=1940300 RepID=A0A8K0XSY1_9AGAR|nr:zinc-finger of the MIZ type in Nse subunit-domain-containing protein [Cristinia sonorae]
MPAASSRRRRRAPSIEAIEEDMPTQVAAGEDLDDQEVEARPSKRAAGAKKRGVKPEKHQQDDDEVNVDDIFPDIITNYENQPLSRAEIQRLAGVAEDWSSMRKAAHTKAYALMSDIAASIAEFGDSEKGEKAILTVDGIMRRLLDTGKEMISHEEVLQEMTQEAGQKKSFPDIVDRYESGVEEMVAKYKTTTSRQKYAKDEDYRKFRQSIWEVQHPDEPMPALTDLVPKENGDDSDDEDDVQVGGVTQDYKCPLSLKPLINPLTSSLCGHSYDAVTIMEFIGQKSSFECPASGCHKITSRAQLEPDKELAKKAKAAQRRERAKNDSDVESDGDEVIE